MPDLQTFQCPACGANLNAGPNPGPTMTCTFCGTSIHVPDGWRSSAPSAVQFVQAPPYAPAHAVLTGPALQQAVVDWLLAQADRQADMHVADQPNVLDRMQMAADKALRLLGSQASADISLPFLAADSRGPKNFQVTLTRVIVDALALGKDRP